MRARVEAGVLKIGLDTDHNAGARRELIIIADLTASHEAVAVATCPGSLDVLIDFRAFGLNGQQRTSRQTANGQGVAGDELAMAVADTPPCVQPGVKARPGEDR